MMLRINDTPTGVRVEVRVQPRSSRNLIVGEQNGALKIKLTSPPVDGAANTALVDFLASSLKISRQNINLLKGATSRNKLIEIDGISSTEFLVRLNLK